MEVTGVLDEAAKLITVLAAANMNVWALLIVCLAWVLVEHMRCARDVKIASIEHGETNPVPPDKRARSGRHKKNRRG